MAMVQRVERFLEVGHSQQAEATQRLQIVERWLRQVLLLTVGTPQLTAGEQHMQKAPQTSAQLPT
jgi:hypothetical protein